MTNIYSLKNIFHCYTNPKSCFALSDNLSFSTAIDSLFANTNLTILCGGSFKEYDPSY